MVTILIAGHAPRDSGSVVVATEAIGIARLFADQPVGERVLERQVLNSKRPTKRELITGIGNLLIESVGLSTGKTSHQISPKA